jgi:hypothetical protein
VLSKYTVIGLIVGGIIVALGVASMIDSLTNPNEIRQTNDTFGFVRESIMEATPRATIMPPTIRPITVYLLNTKKIPIR